MNGLVYSLDDDGDSTPVYWMGIVLAAFVIHAIPFFFLTFKTVEILPADDVFTVSLDDSFLTPVVAPDALVAKDVIESKPVLAEPVAAKPEVLPPVPEPPPAAVVVEAPPAEKERPKTKAPEPPPVPPAAEKKETAEAEKRPLHDRDLPALNTNVDTAFDESTIVTRKPPKNGYLSDRNSTAADHGPKNLTQGDPYIDKGDTNLIKYLQKRGEGNVPAIASDPNSGSVKKEGSPIAGDGGGKRTADFSKSVASAETPSPVPNDVKLHPAPPTLIPAEKLAPVAVAPPPEAIKPDERPMYKPVPALANEHPVYKPVAGEPETMVSETGKKIAAKRVKEIVAEPVQLPVRMEYDPPKRRQPVVSEPAPRPAEVAADPTHANTPAQLQEIGKAIDAQAELDRFARALNGVNSEAASDASAGSTGPRLRPGEQGHEGNGTMRPGDNNAVSDVTSINLESSAAEFGDPRFEKRYDPKTAYIKAFARRIDGKWKADIHAHLRVRLVPGMVSIKIVLRKDGKLMEASEAYRNKGVPDEYVATAKRAVEEAAKPTADPFPTALEDRETIEYTFNFLYE